MGSVPETLNAFGENTLVVRAVSVVLAAVPGAPSIVPYRTVDDAITAVAPFASDACRAVARSYAEDSVACRILEMGAAIDGADRQLARVTAAGGLDAQAADAVLKVLGLAWFAHATGRGESSARVEGFRSFPAGRALLATWAAVDVVLPLGPTDVGRMVAAHRTAAATRWVAIGGEHAMDGIGAVSDAIAPTLQKVVDAAAKRSDHLASVLAPFVPGLIPAAQDRSAPPPGASEQIAVQSDRMPIYKWLAARLAAEHAAARALSG